MNDLQIFNSEEFGAVRTLTINDEPWFVGKDVAEILGYSNTRDTLAKRVDAEDKKDGVAICDSIGREQKPVLINESGLYALILSSKLPSAKRFKRWVTSEILPSIRKHGAFMTPDTIEKVIADPDSMIKLLTALKDEQAKSKALSDKIEQDKPKIIFADAVTTAKTSILIGDLAKLLKQNGIQTGQKRLFEWLRNNGWLIKSGASKNMPTQKAMEMGLFEVKESTIVNADNSIRITRTTKVTGKGQTYFINIFLKDT